MVIDCLMDRTCAGARFDRFRFPQLLSRRYLLAKCNCGRTSPVYPLPAMAGFSANSFGSRRRFTASIDSVKTSLTLRRPRSLT